MDKDSLIKGLETILELIEVVSKEENSGGAIGKLLAEAYDGVVAEYRPYLQAVPEVLGVISKDIAPLVTAFYKISHTLRTDEGVLAACKENDKAKAAGCFRDLEIWMEVGFTREEAMAILLQTIANTNASIAQTVSSTASSVKN